MQKILIVLESFDGITFRRHSDN